MNGDVTPFESIIDQICTIRAKGQATSITFDGTTENTVGDPSDMSTDVFTGPGDVSDVAPEKFGKNLRRKVRNVPQKFNGNLRMKTLIGEQNDLNLDSRKVFGETKEGLINYLLGVGFNVDEANAALETFEEEGAIFVDDQAKTVTSDKFVPDDHESVNAKDTSQSNDLFTSTELYSLNDQKPSSIEDSNLSFATQSQFKNTNEPVDPIFSHPRVSESERPAQARPEPKGYSEAQPPLVEPFTHELKID